MLILSISYVAAAAVFVAVDMIWLGTMAPRFYRPIMGDIALAGVNMAPAVAFYLIYPVGLLLFAVLPFARTGSLGSAMLYGAAFGFFTYATYNLTNFATLRNWNLSLVAVDVAWGTVLAGLTATATCWIVSRFAGQG
jgi:uncharacterized membrane protein